MRRREYVQIYFFVKKGLFSVLSSFYLFCFFVVVEIMHFADFEPNKKINIFKFKNKLKFI